MRSDIMIKQSGRRLNDKHGKEFPAEKDSK
jgi:hypothetical protein